MCKAIACIFATMPAEYPFVRYEPLRFTPDEVKQRAADFFHLMDRRRSVRQFSDAPVPFEVIEHIIRTAGTAPSGAHKQPWTFCVVSDPALKKRIREAAEAEELENYNGRMTAEWLEDLAPLGTDPHKPFLETAPYLIAVFKRAYELKADGSKRKNYYVEESVGIACGFLLAAIHQAGLVSLTHTPSPLNFLTKLLHRPANERPLLLIPIGYPAAECTVPGLQRKPLPDICVHYGPPMQ
jgi:iodotyrosine deiodinase